MYGLPGGSNGGGPLGTIAFWFLIGTTAVIVDGLFRFLVQAVDQEPID